ncbi:MAG TPA: TlpA disulfide reductase family protein [Rhizomicrobium sp.]|nr:TlpA disulfide reductase family protein [Rhizomicrobium sp.]
MKARSIAILAAIVVIAGAAILYGIRLVRVHAPAAPPASLAQLVPAKTPQAIPDVAFMGQDGSRHSLAEFKGKYVLLNLWAVWCAPCVKELPALARLKASAGGARFDVVAVDVARGTPQDAKTFLDGHGASKLATYIDPQLTLMRAFGAYGLPLTILIDDKGREVARAVGPAEWDAPESIDYFKALTAKS